MSRDAGTGAGRSLLLKASGILLGLAVSCSTPGTTAPDVMPDTICSGDACVSRSDVGNQGTPDGDLPGNPEVAAPDGASPDGAGADAADVPVPADTGNEVSQLPDYCICPPALPVCLAHFNDAGEITSYSCSMECKPDAPGSQEGCVGYLGEGACCAAGYTEQGVAGNYCHAAQECCAPCGDGCCPSGTTCEGDGDACVPIGAEYCGEGIWCAPGTVCAAGGCCPANATVECGQSCCPNGWSCSEENLVCVPPGGQYCGDGVVCPNGSVCTQQAGKKLCLPSGYSDCEGHWCATGQVCSEGKCCPELLPNACGTLCCGSDEICAGNGEMCIPDTAKYCGKGVYCVFGYHCAPDMPVCVPDTSDYCGNGKWCKPGEVCAGDGCCPQGLPQKCGGNCCFEYDECSPDGLACIPPASDYCGDGKWCPPGTLCAEGGDICYPVGGEYCGDGHWCDPGMHCSGSVCCGYLDPPVCGKLCCPSGYKCINAGEACIPPGATYCGSGKWCNTGFECKKGGGCMMIGSTECDEEVVCKPGTLCVGLDTGLTCCTEGTAKGCVDICCPDNFDCAKDGSKGICVLPGGKYCGNGVVCAAGYFCASGDKCLPSGWSDCGGGESCPQNQVCKKGGGCCPVSKPVGCGAICCPAGFQCVLDGSFTACLPPGASYCGEGKWCPISTTCPQYVEACIPEGSVECKWGGVCGPGEVCAVGAEKCCGSSTPVACGPICCPSGYICMKLSYGHVCLEPGSTICAYTEKVCPPHSSCSANGMSCVQIGWTSCSEKLQCPPGTVCSEDNTSCGAVGASYCGEGLWCDPGTKCTVDKTGCLPATAVECPDGTWCKAGQTCGSGDTPCIGEEQVACDLDTSCPASQQCTADGNGCVLPDPSCTLEFCDGTAPGFLALGIKKCCSAASGVISKPIAAGTTPNEFMYAIESCSAPNPQYSPRALVAGQYVSLLDNGYGDEPTMNWLSCGQQGDEILILQALWVIDNGRKAYAQDKNGPYGHLYVDFLRLDSTDSFGVKALDKFKLADWNEMLGLDRKHLRGPHNGECPSYDPGPPPKCNGTKPVDGWNDNELVRYQRGGIYKWGSGDWIKGGGDKDKDAVVMVVYEDTGKAGVQREILGLEMVKRPFTTDPCGVWVPLRRFTSPTASGAGKPTGKVAGYALLRTIQVGNEGDPWNCAAATPVVGEVVISLAEEEDVAAWPITFNIEYSFDDSGRFFLPTDGLGNVSEDALLVGDGVEVPEALFGYTAIGSVSVWTPPTVQVTLTPPTDILGTGTIPTGTPLVRLTFVTMHGKADAASFVLKDAKLNKSPTPKAVKLNVLPTALCFKCAEAVPNAATGFRCSASSWQGNPCP